MLFLIALISLGSLAGPDWSECYEETFCIEAEDTGNQVDVYVRSLVAWDFTMSLDMDVENLRPDTSLPVVGSYPGGTRTRAVTLKVKDIGRSWTFQFDMQWVPGDFKARHREGTVYELPYGRGVDFLVGQGPYGDMSHQGKYAIDWDMPEGTPIRAARAGTVIEMRECYTEGGIDPSLKSRANFIKIRHDDGTIGHYVHLRHMGVEVSVGDRVRAGELIGYSGNTGYSTGPHLHFEVFSATRNLSRRTIPIRFRTARCGVTTLAEGTYYRK
ncbi:MAG: M23 family metallopeptidase [Bacteroidota bacterium]|nr:M23 family metallopeptidase [Bacteroidota bacterium]